MQSKQVDSSPYQSIDPRLITQFRIQEFVYACRAKRGPEAEEVQNEDEEITNDTNLDVTQRDSEDYTSYSSDLIKKAIHTKRSTALFEGEGLYASFLEPEEMNTYALLTKDTELHQMAVIKTTAGFYVRGKFVNNQSEFMQYACRLVLHEKEQGFLQKRLKLSNPVPVYGVDGDLMSSPIPVSQTTARMMLARLQNTQLNDPVLQEEFLQKMEGYDFREPGDFEVFCNTSFGFHDYFSIFMQDNECKNYLSSDLIRNISMVFPNNVKQIRKLSRQQLLALNDMTQRDPMMLCFGKTSPHKFLPEISYVKLIEMIKNKHLPEIDEKSIPSYKLAAVAIYHDVLNVDTFSRSFEEAEKNAIDYKPTTSGHTYSLFSNVLKIVPKFSREVVNAAISFLHKNKIIVIIGLRGEVLAKVNKEAVDAFEGAIKIFSSKNYFFLNLITTVLDELVNRWIMAPNAVPLRNEQKTPYLKKTAIELSEEQQNAVDRGVRGPLLIVTGSGGVGKNEVIKKIVERLDESKIILTTLTGKGNSNLSNKIMTADTVHYYLTLHAVWERDCLRAPQLRGSHPFKEMQCLIVDECTMLSVPLFAKLLFMLHAYGNLRQVVFVGDKNQLPSVDYGCVFSDLVGALPSFVITLEKNFRASSETIVENCRKILKHHETPSSTSRNLHLKHDDSFRYYEITAEEMNNVSKLKFHVNKVFEVLIGVRRKTFPDESTAAALIEVIKTTHFIAHENKIADLFNSVIHDMYFASGFVRTNVFPDSLLSIVDPISFARIEAQRAQNILSKPSGGKSSFLNKRNAAISNASKSNVPYDCMVIYPGEKIFFRKNDRDNNIKNGEILTVQKFYDTLKDEPQRKIPRNVGHSADHNINDQGKGDRRVDHMMNSSADPIMAELASSGTFDRYITLAREDGSEMEFRMRDIGMHNSGRFAGLVSFGFATTVHKYQGSEKETIVYCMDGNVKFATSQFAYTSVSRAKSMCIIFGPPNALSQIAFKKPHKRNTHLVEMLRSLRLKEKVDAVMPKVLANEDAVRFMKEMYLEENASRIIPPSSLMVEETTDNAAPSSTSSAPDYASMYTDDDDDFMFSMEVSSAISSTQKTNDIDSTVIEDEEAKPPESTETSSLEETLEDTVSRKDTTKSKSANTIIRITPKRDKKPTERAEENEPTEKESPKQTFFEIIRSKKLESKDDAGTETIKIKDTPRLKKKKKPPCTMALGEDDCMESSVPMLEDSQTSLSSLSSSTSSTSSRKVTSIHSPIGSPTFGKRSSSSCSLSEDSQTSSSSLRSSRDSFFSASEDSNDAFYVPKKRRMKAAMSSRESSQGSQF